MRAMLRGSAALLTGLLVACQAGASIGSVCTRDDECTAPLACRLGRCRQACRDNRDCPVAARCLLDPSGIGACSLDVDERCESGGGTCATGLVCVADQCANGCRTSADCPADGACVAPSGTSTLVCVPSEGRDAGVPTDASSSDAGVDATQADAGFRDAASSDASDAPLLDAPPGVCAGASCAGYVVISELAAAGPGGSRDFDAFIELYNRSAAAADLSGCIVRAEVSGSTLTTFPAGSSISPHGFFLLASHQYSSSVAPDVPNAWSINLPQTSGAFSIVCGGTVLDSLGYDGAVGEGAPTSGVTDFRAGQSYERKALPDSTSATMAAGGRDNFAGNGEDTDDNASDFVVRAVRDPQSTHTGTEP